jgi:rRNA maturation endonuclease Nob1
MKKNHSPLYETYHYKCTKCGTTYPSAKVDKCFVCGSTEPLAYDPVKTKKKKKSNVYGTGIKINL